MPTPRCRLVRGAKYPIAGISPITDDTTAFGVLADALARPMCAETVVLLMDHDYRGLTILTVDGTEHADDIAMVVRRCTEADQHRGVLGALALLTVRPGAEALDVADDLRWWTISSQAARHGVELLEWYVVGARVMLPRQLANDAPRWPADR